MAKIFTSIKFPCGYEYEGSVRGRLSDTGETHLDLKGLPECPLHGKNCFKGGKK